jgi:spore coat protein U-like protein
MNIPRRIAYTMLAIPGALASAPSMAATTDPATVSLSLTLQNSCTLSAGATLSFGTATAGTAQSDIDSQSTGLTIDCADAVSSATINVSAGNNVAAGGQRRLRQGATANFVNYDLYADAGRTTKYDSTTFQTLGNGNLSAGTSDIIIYGRIPSGAALPIGNGSAFTDTVSVTVTY